MKASFLHSTLSLAFLLSVVAVIAMMFLQIPVDDKLLSIVTAVVGAYVGSRIPKTDETSLPEQPTQTYGTE
jgi:hypothetical protein